MTIKNPVLKILTTDLAILLYLCIGWAVPILKGGHFDALIQEGHLSDLAVLVLIWLGYYTLHIVQTGDFTPPGPVTVKLSLDDMNTISVMAARRVAEAGPQTARWTLDDLEQIGSAAARHMPRSVSIDELEVLLQSVLTAHDRPLPASGPPPLPRGLTLTEIEERQRRAMNFAVLSPEPPQVPFHPPAPVPTY